MKKISIFFVMLLAMASLSMGAFYTYIGSVSASTGKTLLTNAVGGTSLSTTYTAVGLSISYFPLTYTAGPIRFYLEDASNTWTATAARVTLTAVPIVSTNEPPYYALGMSGVQSNNSGNGFASGVQFFNGIVLDGGTDAANSSSTTITVEVIGK
jgi:hypothetical protein